VIDSHGLPVYEDDPYRALSYDGEAPAPLVSHLKNTPWIYAGSFSKTLAPGLREGYLIASPELYPHLVKLKQSTDLHSNRPGQWFIAQQLASPDFPAHLQSLRDTYRVGRDAMQAALEKHFADLADWQVPKGGLFFWLTLKQPQDTRELLKVALAECNVAFMPGEPFYPNPEDGIGHLRLNFSHAAPERIEEGIARLAQLVRRLPLSFAGSNKSRSESGFFLAEAASAADRPCAFQHVTPARPERNTACCRVSTAFCGRTACGSPAVPGVPVPEPGRDYRQQAVVPGPMEVDGITVTPMPLATMWRMVLSELPCRVLARPEWWFCLLASSLHACSTWSRKQLPWVSSSTLSSVSWLALTQSCFSQGWPLGVATTKGSSYSGQATVPASSNGSATMMASTSPRLSISASRAV
jgi:hypothetical protein